MKCIIIFLCINWWLKYFLEITTNSLYGQEEISIQIATLMLLKFPYNQISHGYVLVYIQWHDAIKYQYFLKTLHTYDDYLWIITKI